MPMTANGLAKLLEETGELATVTAKKLAYFHTDEHPDGAGSLKWRMEQEMGDVAAAMKFVQQQLDLNSAAIENRACMKLALFQQWHADADNGKEAFNALPGSSPTDVGREDNSVYKEREALLTSLREMHHLACTHLRYRGGMSDGSDDAAVARASALLTEGKTTLDVAAEFAATYITASNLAKACAADPGVKPSDAEVNWAMTRASLHESTQQNEEVANMVSNSTSPFVKHTAHTDALDTLGSIIGPNEKRDAIHLAVEPATCGDPFLNPGEHVYRREDGKYYRSIGDDKGLVGIVDPFLQKPVAQDQRFWLVVYPRQITSLRHVWEHPAFPASWETTSSNSEAKKSGI